MNNKQSYEVNQACTANTTGHTSIMQYHMATDIAVIDIENKRQHECIHRYSDSYRNLTCIKIIRQMWMG